MEQPGRWIIRDEEHDACALIANVRKSGQATHGNVKRTLEGLLKMGHRSGEVAGEGDGCGILVDIQRTLWSRWLEADGLDPQLSHDPRFAVGHIFVAPEYRARSAELVDAMLRDFSASGVRVLASRLGEADDAGLGKRARREAPEFWQVAGLAEQSDETAADRALFELLLRLEAEYPVHVCSLSRSSSAYKVRGSVEVLTRYYPEMRDPDFVSSVTLGHNRYSTNTTSSFQRVQPFTLLGHNGEINTIRRLRREVEMLGIELVPGASDSQDLDRGLAGMIHRYGLSLIEAMEIVFPPIINEIRQFPPDLQDMYMYLRQTWGPFSQGPVAVVARHGNECVFSVDALGLRPLWFGETEKDFFFSSEKGAVPLEDMVCDPRPLAPGEKVALSVAPGQAPQVLDYPRLQREVEQRLRSRGIPWEGDRQFISCGGPVKGPEAVVPSVTSIPDQDPSAVRQRWQAAWAWDFDDVHLIRDWAGSTPRDPIGSLGFDGPLAALSRERQNLSDYFKESVAVVTNPAIDREREIEHFSTRVVVGCRPDFLREADGPRVELFAPLVLGGDGLAPIAAYREVAHRSGTWLYEDLCRELPSCVLALGRRTEETVPQALDRLAGEALGAVRGGAVLIVLDDGILFREPLRVLDPHLAVAAVDRALREERVGGIQFQEGGQVREQGPSLRRRCGILLRSAGVRNLHDLALAIGFGADAVNPYCMLELAREAVDGDPLQGVANLFESVRKGLEKVISTMGNHEVRGYGRLASSIGLRPEVADVFGTPNYMGSDVSGLGWERLGEEGEERRAILDGTMPARPVRTFRLYPFVWKYAGAAGQDPAHYREFEQKVAEMEADHPISLRHCLALHSTRDPLAPEDVEVGVGGHNLPFVISSMSFGSQGETAFRAYAEAAYRLNMIALNGEGGEIKDMLRKYPNNRGQQIASGRFGVNIQLVNSSNLLEIKIGQGAKPGEGGHLPGSKVSAKVAAARNARPGTDLISPSNNHDIYSIEDLAQIIEELKTANPFARVIVKVPVVPGIGTIAVGIAKAGADVITLSGYDGGTGAARKHALRHVGLPAEIGVKEAHRELVASGLREHVEIWCDGGLKTATDVVKMLCLGANRCGFGTMPMVAIGCTICRGCQLDTCHVGIATQMETMEEAMKKGVKRFEPREFEAAVEALCRLFGAMGEELRSITARLGFRRTQDLVGRSDLLTQVAELSRLDLDALVQPVRGDRWQQSGVGEKSPSIRAVHRPRNYLTRLVADMATQVIEEGEELVEYEDDELSSQDRVMGTYLAGEVTRGRFGGKYLHFRSALLSLNGGSVPGNGLAAFNSDGVEIRVEGGAQDGVGKTSFGGRVAVMKGANHDGVRLDGSVGKGLAYGAQKGLFIVQGDADSRAGVRLSGADVVIGGELHGPVHDELGLIASRANIKGFAFEYMTNGRALVLGDPGPWMCSGMTGGVVYIRVQPELGLDVDALRRRIAKGALVELLPVDRRDVTNLNELLGAYVAELRVTEQLEEARRVEALTKDLGVNFVKIVPKGQQVDPSVSTE